MKFEVLATAAVGIVAAAAFTQSTFAAAALAVQDDAAKEAEGPVVMNLYPLDSCPVSGMKLDSKGDAVVKEYDGREVRFCCDGCVAPFEKDTAKFMAKIDEQIIASQGRFYPMETCLVMDGEALMEDGEFIGQDVVVHNRLVRTCCKMCVAEVKKNPAKYIAKLNEAIIAQQREHYPLETCAVRETSELGSMGDAAEVIVANRLVKFCCAGCFGEFKKNPAKYIARLDEAWMKAHNAAGH